LQKTKGGKFVKILYQPRRGGKKKKRSGEQPQKTKN